MAQVEPPQTSLKVILLEDPYAVLDELALQQERGDDELSRLNKTLLTPQEWGFDDERGVPTYAGRYCCAVVIDELDKLTRYARPPFKRGCPNCGRVWQLELDAERWLAHRNETNGPV